MNRIDEIGLSNTCTEKMSILTGTSATDVDRWKKVHMIRKIDIPCQLHMLQFRNVYPLIQQSIRYSIPLMSVMEKFDIVNKNINNVDLNLIIDHLNKC